jgi:hypothetical protein
MPVDERKAIIHAHLRRTRAAADQRVKISHLPSHFGPRYVVAIVFHITLASAPILHVWCEEWENVAEVLTIVLPPHTHSISLATGPHVRAQARG